VTSELKLQAKPLLKSHLLTTDHGLLIREENCQLLWMRQNLKQSNCSCLC